ncbi:MAG: NusG domain II-containing protein [Deltaproteobacteria bacterium]|nr:NusG domain II-containing protein [Candidatus Zymogenaceae bacterium]
MFTRADKILIISLIVISAASYPALKYLSQGGSFLEVEVEGETMTVVRMDQDQDITVEGRLGTTIIRIDENGARFIKSPCVDKKCIKSAPIEDAGEIAVCVPNRVMIRILGENRVKTDFISR